MGSTHVRMRDQKNIISTTQVRNTTTEMQIKNFEFPLFAYKVNGLENIVYIEALVNTSQDIRILTVIASPKKATDS